MSDKVAALIEQGKRNARRRGVTVCCSAIITMALLFGFARITAVNTTDEKIVNPVEPSVTESSSTDVSESSSSESESSDTEIPEKILPDKINISMNSNPVFPSGEEKGNLNIINNTVNNFPQTVEIIRNDNGARIYSSGVIAVGDKIESDKLSEVLPAGNYECTAIFSSVDPETNEVLGSAAAIIIITVQK